MKRLAHSACVLALVLSSCRQEAASNGDAPASEPKSKHAELLIFTADLRVTDDSLNAFVTRAMTVCSTGDYEQFRLLWSARQEPLPRAEFEEGWHAVQRIEVRVLQKAMLEADAAAGREAPQPVYALLVDVSLDPALKAGQKEPVRHVVLMIVSENGEWRLARAPKAMREWIKSKLSHDASPDNATTMAPNPP